MSSRRTIILIAALVVGAIAAMLIFSYVGGIEKKVEGDTAMVPVVIAKANVNKGAGSDELIGTGAIGLAERRVADLPSSAVKRPEDIKSQVAVIDILPGTVITTQMFANPNEATDTNSNVLDAGMVAVTMSTDQVRGVAGLIRPGDYVNMMVKGPCGLDGATIGAAAAAGDGTEADAAAVLPECMGLLYQKARVLAVGQSLGTPVAAADADPTATTVPVSSDLITFEVPQDAAQAIALASSTASIYMTLIRQDYEPVPIPATVQPLPLPGVGGNTPYGVDPEADPEAATDGS